VGFHIPCDTGEFDARELKTEVVEEGDKTGVVGAVNDGAVVDGGVDGDEDGGVCVDLGAAAEHDEVRRCCVFAYAEFGG